MRYPVMMRLLVCAKQGEGCERTMIGLAMLRNAHATLDFVRSRTKLIVLRKVYSAADSMMTTITFYTKRRSVLHSRSPARYETNLQAANTTDGRDSAVTNEDTVADETDGQDVGAVMKPVSKGDRSDAA